MHRLRSPGLDSVRRPADCADYEHVADEDDAVGHQLDQDQLQPEDVDGDVDRVPAEFCARVNWQTVLIN